MQRPVVLAAGTSAGFSATALLEFVARTDWISFLSFVGSAVATGIGWYLARRAEIARAEIQLEHDRRQAARDEMIADALAALKIRQCHTMLASVLTQPHSEGS